MSSQSRLLVLKQGDFQEAVLYRLEKGWRLHFILDASLTGLPVRLFVNHPIDPKEGSNRSKYREVEWSNECKMRTDNYDAYAEVPMVLAGSFNYYFTVNEGSEKSEANGGGYFLVDPVLHVGKMDDRLSLDSICCQTVMPKLLGVFNEWPQRLKVSHESGYNMIHFTPIQELGKSNSAYCLKDQRKLDPRYCTKERTYSMKDVKQLVEDLKNNWNMLSLTDLVFNHTANESPWILAHPECSYNMINSPHLKPAYLMDRVLWHFSLEVGQGRWESRGIPPVLSTEEHLSAIQNIVRDEIIPKHKFWEFNQCCIEDVIIQFKSAILSGTRGDDKPSSDLFLLPDIKYRRLKCTIDIPLAVKNYYSCQPDETSRDVKISTACENLRSKLNDLNARGSAQIMEHVNCAINNFIANARWRFIDDKGMRLGKVTPDSPIMWNYFTLPDKQMTVEQEEKAMNSEEGAYCMAHNGWVMCDDPLRNFAEPGSNVYLRRELIPWGDSVKLRYGRRFEDCPYLWNYMRDYTVETASIFHGVRLDNCHSTPIHVAEYMLDEARKARPDLYVIAELFTSSEYADNTFINRLGINSLIREGLNGWSPRELGRLVHRFAGDPVGSFIQLSARYIMPSVAHALFMDQSHDNESVIQKHTAIDLLPYSSVIAMSCSAIGSNRGYDEMVPHHIDVVKESRLYRKWSAGNKGEERVSVDGNVGIIRAKKMLNDIHLHLEKGGYKEIFVDSVTDDVISVTRHNSTSHQSIILYAHTSFSTNSRGGSLHHITIPGVIEEVIFEGHLAQTGEENFTQDPVYIGGLEKIQLTTSQNLKPSESKTFKIINPENTKESVVHFHNLPPGSVAIIRVNLPFAVRESILQVRQLLTGFGYQMRTFSSRRVSLTAHPLEKIFDSMTFDDLHRVLYRLDQEEKDDGHGFGTYDVPNFGRLRYCGLQGVVTLLDKIRPSNNLGHPLCGNLREGDWMLDYIADRLIPYPGTSELGQWFKKAFSSLKKAPRYLIPMYFDAIVNGVYTLAVEQCWKMMSSFAADSSKFVRDLSLGSVQMCSYVPTAKLPKLSNHLHKPHPPSSTNHDGFPVEACLTLCAGLPHFSTGIFRNWGRDTFIAIRGLLLLTGRFTEARFIILGYAGCLRHGLIPNLLGEGLSARYNCRDAVWFWLQCIKDYCLLAPEGHSILKDKVLRLYPTDESPVTTDKDQLLEEVIQEALQKHATGLKFRERNAGWQIDSEMKDEGFNNTIGVDWTTGFVYGGNDFNCGTWMDKMGSSQQAGNKGVPATPRDGSAVEIVGLCASVVHWLAEMDRKNVYPYKGVKDGSSNLRSWEAWFRLIADNFEKRFWIDPVSNDPQIHDTTLINRRGVYKDTVGSTKRYTDYQLRCNFPIAITVCPDLVSPGKAWQALTMVEKHLLGPLGVKTLDSSDYNYIGDYYNSDDSSDYKKSKGFNYHQGPEWVWPIGFFLRAKLITAQRLSSGSNKNTTNEMAPPSSSSILKDTLTFVEKKLTAHNEHLQSSDWKSIPELTNSNGTHCPDSCAAQAWSVGCLLEVLYEMFTIHSSSVTPV